MRKITQRELLGPYLPTALKNVLLSGGIAASASH